MFSRALPSADRLTEPEPCSKVTSAVADKVIRTQPESNSVSGKIMPAASSASCNTDLCKQQEIKKQRQRKALGCNPQKPCSLKCNICFEEDRKAAAQKTI